MKILKQSIIVFNCIVFSFILFVLPACQVRNQAAVTTDKSAKNQIKTTQMAKEIKGSIAVPRTGQKITFLDNDDGDLRAGKVWPTPRFTDHKNGTVTDNLTGLMWTQNANQVNGGADWEEAVSGAAKCIDGGYSDWRLPNRNELASLLDLGRYGPALPENHHFSNVQSDYYWTSTTLANGEDQAWVIHFYIGFVTSDDNGGDHYVWYVRNDSTR